MFARFKQGVPCDDEQYAVLLKRVEIVLDVYEVILGKQKYIGGNVRLLNISHKVVSHQTLVIRNLL